MYKKLLVHAGNRKCETFKGNNTKELNSVFLLPKKSVQFLNLLNSKKILVHKKKKLYCSITSEFILRLKISSF